MARGLDRGTGGIGNAGGVHGLLRVRGGIHVLLLLGLLDLRSLFFLLFLLLQ